MRKYPMSDLTRQGGVLITPKKQTDSFIAEVWKKEASKCFEASSWFVDELKLQELRRSVNG
jgi:hypothetical protein